MYKTMLVLQAAHHAEVCQVLWCRGHLRIFRRRVDRNNAAIVIDRRAAAAAAVDNRPGLQPAFGLCVKRRRVGQQGDLTERRRPADERDRVELILEVLGLAELQALWQTQIFCRCPL